MCGPSKTTWKCLSLYPENKFASGTGAKSVEMASEITGC